MSVPSAPPAELRAIVAAQRRALRAMHAASGASAARSAARPGRPTRAPAPMRRQRAREDVLAATRWTAAAAWPPPPRRRRVAVHIGGGPSPSTAAEAARARDAPALATVSHRGVSPALGGPREAGTGVPGDRQDHFGWRATTYRRRPAGRPPGDHRRLPPRRPARRLQHRRRSGRSASGRRRSSTRATACTCAASARAGARWSRGSAAATPVCSPVPASPRAPSCASARGRRAERCRY